MKKTKETVFQHCYSYSNQCYTCSIKDIIGYIAGPSANLKLCSVMKCTYLFAPFVSVLVKYYIIREITLHPICNLVILHYKNSHSCRL